MNSTNSTFEFAQKVALIAGGTGGLGSALATELRSRGCIVTTVSRTQLTHLTHLTQSTDTNHIAADLRSPESATAVVDQVFTQHGALDIVINAMGVVAFGEISATTVDTVEEVFLTNTFGHIFLMQAALRKISQGSVLVGISGIIAEQNLPGMSVYGASKSAVRSFNEALAREARKVGVRVIDARPPHTETGLASRAVAGTAPKFPRGLEPVTVAQRIITAIANGETDLASTAFSN